MYIKQLQTFLTVAKNKSFVRSAEQLYLSQPAVTQQIQSLEKELGFPLFIRTKHRVELTPAGKAFLSGAQQIVDIYYNTRENCNRIFKSTPTCTIHYLGNANMHHIPNILREFHRLFPSYHIATRRVKPEETVNLLKNGSARLLLTPEDLVRGWGGITFRPLYQAGYYGVMSADHPLSQLPELSVAQLEGCTFLVPASEYSFQHIENFYKHLEVLMPDFRRISVTGIDDAFAHLLCSQSIAIMPEYTCPRHPELVSIPLSFNKTITYGIAYKEPLISAETKLVKFLISSFQNLRQVPARE